MILKVRPAASHVRLRRSCLATISVFYLFLILSVWRLRLFTLTPHTLRFVFATFRHVMTFHFGGSGGMHGTRRWMALNVGSVRSWTAADCSPEDGQARI